MVVKNIIFDMDGVLIDSLPNLYNWFKFLSVKEGIKIKKSFEEFKNLTFEPIPNLYKNMGFDWDNRKDIIRERFGFYNTNHLAPLIGGIEDFLISVREDFSLGVASNSAKVVVDYKLEKHGLTDYFLSAIAADQLTPDEFGNFPGKPKPDLILKFLKDNEMNPCETVYVGDQATDVIASKGAGVISLALITNSSFSSEEELLNSKPDLKAYSLDDISLAIDSHNKNYDYK